MTVSGDELMAEAGADSVWIDEEGNVLALRRGRTGRRTVALGGHLDTVFPEGTDVTVRQRGDTLFAPGVGDDTRGLIVVLAVLRALNEVGIRTESDLLFIGTVGEEGLGDLRGVKQLFGESEGKQHRGLFPAAVRYSTDLHSIGQYVQDGQRSLAETFLVVERQDVSPRVPETGRNQDGLDYLVGRSLHEINLKAHAGTAAAHHEGGVPVMTLWMDNLSAETIGQVIYFFEHGVAVGGYLLGVNPFDQPGVEAYKRKMFSLLGRPDL